MSLALLWTLMLEAHSGFASPVEIAKNFDDLVRWGTKLNPDQEAAANPDLPATPEEKAAAAGLLALASGR